MLNVARGGRAGSNREQNDGEAWLIAEEGAVIRRWIAECPELAMGEPFGVEHRLLDAFGIPGRLEDLDPQRRPGQQLGGYLGRLRRADSRGGVEP
ncbi:hypothetical protein [Streptomyces sp. R41]|uniref:Uncharacterized protein n=1 Tax=Streptomyces sp. R41 TaxID=3238632 RepID=A0AB39R7K1_9ACTN